METFDFKLILERVDVNEAEADAIYANCKDGTLITADGVEFLDFGREADSLESAIRSAIADVNACGFRVARVEVEVDQLVAQQI